MSQKINYENNLVINHVEKKVKQRIQDSLICCPKKQNVDHVEGFSEIDDNVDNAGKCSQMTESMCKSYADSAQLSGGAFYGAGGGSSGWSNNKQNPYGCIYSGPGPNSGKKTNIFWNKAYMGKKFRSDFNGIICNNKIITKKRANMFVRYIPAARRKSMTRMAIRRAKLCSQMTESMCKSYADSAQLAGGAFYGVGGGSSGWSNNKQNPHGCIYSGPGPNSGKKTNIFWNKAQGGTKFRSDFNGMICNNKIISKKDAELVVRYIPEAKRKMQKRLVRNIDTDRQPSVVARRNTDTDRQPSVVARRNTDTDRQPSVVARRNIDTDRQPSVVAKKEKESSGPSFLLILFILALIGGGGGYIYFMYLKKYKGNSESFDDSAIPSDLRDLDE